MPAACPGDIAARAWPMPDDKAQISDQVTYFLLDAHITTNCVRQFLLFGNVSGSGLATFGKDAQYGMNVFNTDGYPQFISKTHGNPCV